MGQLINGKWSSSDEPQPPSPHKYELGTEQFPFDASTKGRYHLYVSRSCPFAHRAEIALAVKHLGDDIDTSYVYPVNTTEGWSFDPKGAEPSNGVEISEVKDKIYGLKLLHEVYSRLDPKYSGRVTVPLLVDTKENRIVSNESADIVQIFGKIGTAGPNLLAHPDAQTAAAPFFGQFFGGLFGIGRTDDQESYDKAVHDFYEVVQRLDAYLASRKYLAGHELTAVDINTFPALIRFDLGLSLLLNVTKARLSDYKNIDVYLRRVYQHDGVRGTVSRRDNYLSIFAPGSRARFDKPKKEFIVPAMPNVNWEEPIEEA